MLNLSHLIKVLVDSSRLLNAPESCDRQREALKHRGKLSERENLHTETLDTGVFTPNNFYTEKIYARETFSERNSSTQTACTQRNSYTKKLSEIETFTHSKLLHADFLHSTHLHREDFAHRELLCTDFFTQRPF